LLCFFSLADLYVCPTSCRTPNIFSQWLELEWKSVASVAMLCGLVELSACFFFYRNYQHVSTVTSTYISGPCTCIVLKLEPYVGSPDRRKCPKFVEEHHLFEQSVLKTHNLWLLRYANRQKCHVQHRFTEKSTQSGKRTQSCPNF